MTGKEVFKIWAPEGVKWVDWVRPVPFISINDNFKNYEVCDFTIPKISYMKKELLDDTAIFIDLPSYNSIKEGLALVKLGYRPIPIYNGTNGQKGAMSIIDNNSIEMALIWGALELNKINVSDNAPPVFLLDSNRTNRARINVSVFDNSWDIYDQDVPPAEYFLKNGINKIIIRGDSIQKDLSKILYNFQKKKIKILFTNGYEEPKEIIIKKPRKKKNE